VPSSQIISYAQRYEDMHLLRCFEGQTSGFYIDIGAGHPVHDNVSFAFYLRGWRGVTVEPNPWLAQLSEAVRPHDTRVQSLIGASEGEANYYLVQDFHGFSTTIESHARAAQDVYGKTSQAMIMPVTTLRTLAEQHASTDIDFLKIDVEGAEGAVIEGGDWRRFRPKVVVLEALAPVTLAPAWDWEPMLTRHDYRFMLFDGLNRYYVAAEQGEIAARLADTPKVFPAVVQFRNFKPAADDCSHPDHRLAVLLAGADMIRLPLLPAEQVAALLTASLDPSDLARLATPADVAALHHRLFDTPPAADWTSRLALPPTGTVADLYRHAVATEPFRAACGRISASSAW
jgi:FkbM family methyltransferase